MEDDMPTIVLTEQQLEMLLNAVDSHIYWQLSDPLYRRDGFVLDPGSDDKEEAEHIAAYRELETALEAVARS
jgi:hypothetical protein